MHNYFIPLFKDHFARNMRFEINKRHFATVEMLRPGIKPLHTRSMKVLTRHRTSRIEVSPNIATNGLAAARRTKETGN